MFPNSNKKKNTSNRMSKKPEILKNGAIKENAYILIVSI